MEFDIGKATLRLAHLDAKLTTAGSEMRLSAALFRSLKDRLEMALLILRSEANIAGIRDCAKKEIDACVLAYPAVAERFNKAVANHDAIASEAMAIGKEIGAQTEEAISNLQRATQSSATEAESRSGEVPPN